MIIREAAVSDNDGLLNLTAMTSMAARISIRIDRQPDFFSLIRQRGNYKVFIAEEQDRIIGSFTAVMEQFAVHGVEESCCYVCDLKVLPDYQGSSVAFGLLKTMRDFLLGSGTDMVFCTAAYGNQQIMSLFPGRAGMPSFEIAGLFKVYQIFPLRSGTRNPKYPVKEDISNPDLSQFYNTFYKRYQFCPVVTDESLRDTKTFLVRINNEIKASISLADMGTSKQNVLISLPWLSGILFRLIRILSRPFGGYYWPEWNKPMRILYVRAFGYEPGYEDAMKQLIRKARHFAFENKYSFMTAGVHEKDPSAVFFKKKAWFIFKSYILISSQKNRTQDIQRIKQGLLFEDYSLV